MTTAKDSTGPRARCLTCGAARPAVLCCREVDSGPCPGACQWLVGICRKCARFEDGAAFPPCRCRLPEVAPGELFTAEHFGR